MPFNLHSFHPSARLVIRACARPDSLSSPHLLPLSFSQPTVFRSSVSSFPFPQPIPSLPFATWCRSPAKAHKALTFISYQRPTFERRSPDFSGFNRKKCSPSRSLRLACSPFLLSLTPPLPSHALLPRPSLSTLPPPLPLRSRPSRPAASLRRPR